MFSIKQKRNIADKVQQILKETNHSELPTIGEINFTLHVKGKENWSWADIQNNAAISIPSVNPWNEAQDKTTLTKSRNSHEPDKMKSVIVLEMTNGAVECISNPTDTEIVLHDFDIQDTDNPNFEYGNDGDDDFMIIRFPGEGMPTEPQHGREPDKVKPLAQYLNEYIEHEIDIGNIRPAVSDLYAWDSWRELLEQALDAYKSTEQVKIRIERV